MDGECIYIISNILREPLTGNPTIVLPEKKLNDCCGYNSLKALADVATTDSIKNDVAGILFPFEQQIPDAVLKLQKFVNGDFQDIEDLNNNNFGTYYAYGFFVNSFLQKFIGYQLEWRKVLIAHENGSYRVKCIYDTNKEVFSREYCLQQYTPDRANGTVRIEHYNNGLFGNFEFDKRQNDYGTLNWRNQMRFMGYFYYSKSTYENEYVQYENGNRIWTKSEQEPEYILTLMQLPFFAHDIMRVNVMQADQILITDYNSTNATQYVNKSVQPTSEYSPEWYILQSKQAGVDITFRQAYNNLKKYRNP